MSAEASDTHPTPRQRQPSTAYCFSGRFNIDSRGTSVTRAEARERLRDYCSDLLRGRLCDPEGGILSTSAAAASSLASSAEASAFLWNFEAVAFCSEG